MATEFTDQASAFVVPVPVGEPPVGYAGYPRADHLKEFIADARLTPADGILKAAVLAGIERVEGQCQRHFVAGMKVDNTTEDAATRLFDSATMRAAVCTGISIDFGAYGDLARCDAVVFQPASGTPQTLVEGTDYRLLPLNAPSRGRPYTYLELRRQHWTRPLSATHWGELEVSGLWGYSTSLPGDVWLAMLSAASLILFSSQFRAAGVPVGIKSWTGPGGVQTVFDATTLTARLAQWQMAVDDVVGRYERKAW